MVVCLFVSSIIRFHTNGNVEITVYTNYLMMVSFFLGLGPGSLGKINKDFIQHASGRFCIPGSNHGGNVPNDVNFEVGDSYDKDNLTTLQGGSGGDAILLLSLYFFFILLFLQFLSRINKGYKN